MKTQQGAELPDELLIKEVTDSNLLASVTIITRAELETLLDRRIIDSGWRCFWPFNRRSA